MRAHDIVNHLLETGPDDINPREYVDSTPMWWTDLDDFTKAYIEAALWSTNDESTPSGGVPMDQNYSREDIAPETLKQMAEDCIEFQKENEGDLADYPGYAQWSGAEMAGHVFWLTRNGHGTGFWDRDFLPQDVKDRLTASSERFGAVYLSVGDDSLIHS